MNDQSMIQDATASYLEHNTELNRQIMAAPDAATRQALLEEKNELIKELETDLDFSTSRPEPSPDLPVFDLRGMDELISREAELAKLAESEKPKLNIGKTLGFSVVFAAVMFGLGLLSIQLISFAKDYQPTMSEAEQLRSQIEETLAAVGDSQSINTSANIDELKEKLSLIRQAIAALASGGTDEELEELVYQRREEIKSRLSSLSKKQRS